MTVPSKIIYFIAVAVLCMNFFFTNRGWWSLTMILAVSASPVLLPNKWNIVLSICAAVSIGAVGFGMISGTAGTVLSGIAVTSATLSMALGFFRYIVRRISPKPVDVPPTPSVKP